MQRYYRAPCKDDSDDKDDNAVWVNDEEEDEGEDTVDDGFQRNIFHKINQLFGIE